MNKKIKKKITEYIDKTTAINTKFTGKNTFVIDDYSSYGEDIYEEYDFKDLDDLIEQLYDHYNDFEVGDYFKMWYGANKGEPQEPKDLLNAGEEHKNIIKQVYEAINELSQKQLKEVL